MMKQLAHLSLLISGLTALPLALPSSTQAGQCCLAKDGQTKLSTQIIATGLESPWGLAFLPDGSLLVTERTGSLRHVVKGNVSKLLKGLPEIEEVGQGGLLDIALDPDFAKNSLIYLSYSQPDQRGRKYGTAMAKAKLKLKAQRLDNLKVIFTSNIKSSGGRHFGSRLRFAKDKTLFVTLGERGTQKRAQNAMDHAGSVIRINRDGSVPKDNPFIGNGKALPELWSIGHRNPQGAAIHPKTGELWTLSTGQRAVMK